MEPYYIRVGDTKRRSSHKIEKGAGLALQIFDRIGEVAVKHGDSVLSRGRIYR